MRYALLLGVLAACGTSDDTNDPPVDCAALTGNDTFVVGLEKTGAKGLVDYQLMSATPAPPVRGNNTWVVQISAMTSGAVGDPLSSATLEVSPYMPAHGHYSAIATVVTPMSDAGQYKLSPVSLSMPGVWETTITVKSGTTTDSAVYKFCIPE